MATHHGRPGGRFLELGLVVGLVALSVGFFLGVMALAFFALDRILPDGAHKVGGPILILIATFATYLLKFPWNAFLKYYRYEAHTLRPIKDETTSVSGNGIDKSEG